MSGLIVVFSALGGTTGSIITGHIFQAYGGEKAFYFSLIPIFILIVLLIAFNHLQKKYTAKQPVPMPIITDPLSEEYKQ